MHEVRRGLTTDPFMQKKYFVPKSWLIVIDMYISKKGFDNQLSFGEKSIFVPKSWLQTQAQKRQSWRRRHDEHNLFILYPIFLSFHNHKIGIIMNVVCCSYFSPTILKYVIGITLCKVMRAWHARLLLRTHHDTHCFSSWMPWKWTFLLLPQVPWPIWH